MNSTARTLDIGTVLINQSNALVITSPEMKQQLLERFDKYIFPADKVEVCACLMSCTDCQCAPCPAFPSPTSSFLPPFILFRMALLLFDTGHRSRLPATGQSASRANLQQMWERGICLPGVHVGQKCESHLFCRSATSLSSAQC